MEFPGKKTTLNQPPSPREAGRTRYLNSPCFWSESFNLWSPVSSSVSSYELFLRLFTKIFPGLAHPGHWSFCPKAPTPSPHSLYCPTVALSLPEFASDFLSSKPNSHQTLTVRGLCSSSSFCWVCSWLHPRRPAQSWHVPGAQTVVLSE